MFPGSCNPSIGSRLSNNYIQQILPVQLLSSESESRSVTSNSLWPRGLYSPWNSPGQNTGVGSRSLLQGIFSTQELKPGLLHCRRILYQLSYLGSADCNLIHGSQNTQRGKESLFNTQCWEDWIFTCKRISLYFILPQKLTLKKSKTWLQDLQFSHSVMSDSVTP